jgi:hypothetical protein
MNTKLTINLKDGVLDVEGSEEFVRTIYSDFKDEVAKRQVGSGLPQQIGATRLPVQEPIIVSQQPKAKKQPRAKRVASGSDGQKVRSGKYKPSFDPSLDLKRLPEFYDGLAPANAAEKILIFMVFLKENLNIDHCTADHIYTCFFTVKDRTRIPEAFEQAFRDTQSRTHFIQVSSLQDITLTIPGSNRFEEMKKRKIAE